jgi:hypothetical protein
MDSLGKAASKHMSKKSMGKKEAKFAKVMHEFKHGSLKSSSGQKVTSRKQAIAISYSEAGMK